MANIGEKIRITYMDGEPQYTGREGTVTHIDDMGQIHGTWGGCAVIPETDSYELVDEEEEIIDDVEEPCDLEMGFNPYMGSYDFDC